MSEILLLDFEEQDYRQLIDKKYDVEWKLTNWKSGKTEPLIPPKDCRVVLYQISSESALPNVHSEVSGEFEHIVEEGGAFICFIGKGNPFQLTNLTGTFPHLEFVDCNHPQAVTSVPEKPFDLVFEKYAKFISRAHRLFPADLIKDGPVKLETAESVFRGELQVLARSADGSPISAIIRKGKGFYLFFPWFGNKNAEVSDLLLRELFPVLSLRGTSAEDYQWLEKEDYIFPSLLEIYRQREEEKKRHEEALRQLDAKFREIKDKDQESYHRLLKSQGRELKQAVVAAFTSLGWAKVIDVDEYWKKVIRNKEEDIWLIEENSLPVEVKLKKDPLILVVVKSGKDWATDDDCAVLQKYKGRRMQEFDNTKMKAILVGNYYAKIEANLRKNPFAQVQVDETEKDGNALLTTYDLFKAIKAEKENKVRKEEVREMIKTKSGLISLDF
jgi:hypothetical protein